MAGGANSCNPVRILTNRLDGVAPIFSPPRIGTVTMKVPALFLVGSLSIAAAQAQSKDAQIDFLPMPKTLPLVFFSPDSLAGTMLEPLEDPDTAPQATATAAHADAAMEEAAGSKEAAPLDELRREAVAQADPEQPAEELEEPDAAPESAEAPAETASVEPAATTVRVIVENVESDIGMVNVAVCDTDFSPAGCPYQAEIPASPGFVETMFDDVPPGVYAVVGYHDVNGNNKFDRFLGVPREPFALSGAAAEKLVPQFSDAALNINQGENYVIIRMKRLGG